MISDLIEISIKELYQNTQKIYELNMLNKTVKMAFNDLKKH